MSRLVTSHMVENSLSNTRLCHKCAERHSRFSHCASYEGAHQMLTEDLHALCVSSVNTDFGLCFWRFMMRQSTSSLAQLNLNQHLYSPESASNANNPARARQVKNSQSSYWNLNERSQRINWVSVFEGDEGKMSRRFAIYDVQLTNTNIVHV